MMADTSDMGIQFNQIHNVVRTNRRVLHIPPFIRQDAEHKRGDGIVISPRGERAGIYS